MEAKPSTSSTDGFNALTQQEIIMVVNNIGPDLLSLGRELQLTRTQLAELERSKESLQERAQKMVDWWSQKDGKTATKNGMVEALKQIRRRDMADKLFDCMPFTTENDKLTDFTKLQQRLIKRYSHYCIPQPPNIKKILPIDSIFIHQEMETNDKQSKHKTQDVQITDLFTPVSEQPVTRILVEGDPGFGKTTLAVKLACDWAKGRDYIASSFHLVILIPLKEVKGERLEDVIIGIIHRAVGNKSLTRNELKSYLSQHKVLLVLDGYDEMTVEHRNNLKDILEKEKLETVCILVTCRKGIFTNEEHFEPSMSLILFQEENNMGCELWDKRIELKGLTSLQRLKLLKDNFEISQEAMNKMKELFSRNTDDMFRCPLLVFWLGWMLEKNPIGEIGTRTAFYKALINLIFHKTLFRENKIKETDTLDIFNLSDNPETITLKQQIHQFGRLAMNKLICHDLSFTEEDLGDLSGSLLFVSDLFVRYKSLVRMEEETHYQTIHKSFLEFLAAYSICYSVNNQQISFREFKTSIVNMVKQGLGPSRDSLLFPFVAGLLEQRAHWLFDALSPWSAIFNVCQLEMVNILVEMTHNSDEIFQSLTKFIPSYYKICHLRGFDKRYYSSDCFIKLFETSAKQKLISVLYWEISVKYPLPVTALEVERLYLKIPANPLSTMLPLSPIDCNELICYIDKNVSQTTWDSFVTVISTVNTKHHHLDIRDMDAFSFTVILKEILHGQWSHRNFQRVRLTGIPLKDNHLEVLAQLVAKNRIQKGVFVDISEDDNMTASTQAMGQLWNAVLLSKSIDEFEFANSDSRYKAFFDLSHISDDKRKSSFEMIHFIFYFNLTKRASNLCVESIQDLSLHNVSCPEDDLINFLRNTRDVKYFECFDYLFPYCISNDFPFLASLTDLCLIILTGVVLPFSSSVLGQMPCLQALTIDVSSFCSESIPQPVDEFLVAILNSRKLNYLAFDFISSTNVLLGLMNTISKAHHQLELFCLQLLFKRNLVMDIPPSVLNPIRALLKQKQLQQIAIVEHFPSASLRSVLPVLFSEDEFQFKHEINGREKSHSIRNQERYERFMINRIRLIIELKNETHTVDT